MTELDRMRRVFDRQIEAAEQAGPLVKADWPALRYEVRPRPVKDGGGHFLRLQGLEVGFAFDADGRLIGAYNWKE